MSQENHSLTTIRESLSENYNIIHKLTGILSSYVVSKTLESNIFNKADLETRVEELLIEVKTLDEDGHLQRFPEILKETQTTVNHTRNFLTRLN